MKYQNFISDRTKFYKIVEPLELELGGTLNQVQIAYRTWGNLNKKGDNAVLICHGFSANADADIWWDELFGEAKIFNPEQDFIVCTNVLGSCYGSTGAISINPETGTVYGASFPAITIRDMVRSQYELMQGLGISQWKLVIGGSMGGMQTLEWAVMYPDLVRRIVAISTSGRHSPWSIALGETQRQAIYADPLWQDGNYEDNSPHHGLAIARMIATCAYYSYPNFIERFARKIDGDGNFAITNYLHQEGQKFLKRFDANVYVSLTKAMDTHDLGRDRGDYLQVLNRIYQPTLIVTTPNDLLYVPAEQEELAEVIPNAKLAELVSTHGHDAFLIDIPNLNCLLQKFINNI